MGDVLPARLTAAEVCRLARYGPATLTARIKAGRMPKPVETTNTRIFDRDEVLTALGMKHDAPRQVGEFDEDDYREAMARALRDRQRAKGGRHVPRAVRGARKAPALRLVADNPAAG